MPYEYTVRWSGARVGLGASVFHYRPAGGPTGATSIQTATRVFFEAIKGYIPSGITITYDREVRQLDNAGNLEEVFPLGQVNTTGGSGGTVFVNGAGAMIRWSTGAVSGGRRLQGRTFLVPFSTAGISGGEVTTAAQGVVNAAAATYISSLTSAGPSLVVWSRTNGTTADALTGALLSRPSSLRTRNDRD